MRKCHLACSQKNVFVLRPSCLLGHKLQTAYLAQHMCLLQDWWDRWVFCRRFYEADDEMDYFIGPHFRVPNCFWLLQLEHFPNAVCEILMQNFLKSGFPPGFCDHKSLCISNVQPPLTDFRLTCAMAGSKKTPYFCKNTRNHPKERGRKSK